MSHTATHWARELGDEGHGTRRILDILRGYLDGTLDTPAHYEDADGLASLDYLEVTQADGIRRRVSLSSFIAHLALTLGTGTGGDPVILPVLPPSFAQNVPANLPDGAIIARVTPIVAGSPAPTYSMLSVDGIDIRADTGDIYITDNAAYFALFVDDTTTVTTTVTASNASGSTGGFSSCDYTFTKIDDYQGITSAYDANKVQHYSIMDLRTVRVDPVTSLATLVKDLSVEARDATNPLQRVGYAQVGTIGPNRPALRGNGNAGPTTGMFFNQNPLWRGPRTISFAQTSLNDRMTLSIDQMYKNSGGTGGPPDETSLQDVWLLFTRGSLAGKVSLFTVIVDGASLTYRLNGVQIGTLTLNSYNQPREPFIFFALVNIIGFTGTNNLIGVSALMQGRSWKGNAFNGDFGEYLLYRNVTSSEGPETPPTPTTASDLTFVTHKESALDSGFTAPYTFASTGFSAGLIIVTGVIRASGAPTITAVTIGTVDAVVAVEARNTSNNLSSAFICYAVVDPGVTGSTNVVVALSANAVLCGISVYQTTVYESAAPTTVATAIRGATTGTMSPTLINPDVGFQISVATAFGGTNRKHTSASAKDGAVSAITVSCTDNAAAWTGLTEDVETTVEAGAIAVMAVASAGWKLPVA